MYSQEWEHFLTYVQIIKLDIIAIGLDETCEFVKQHESRGSRRKFLAWRVETKQDFLTARSARFSFFQDYFLANQR